MSLVTKCIGLAKRMKHRYEARLKARTPVYLSPVRRIERVSTPDRVVAMTFDDGPCRMPPSPAGDWGDKPLTLCLLETLERFGARGTFDIVGSTADNYPDQPGKHGSASWGGLRYDHYPDIHHDGEGGALAAPELVKRILEGGHEITNHTYAHVLFGPKALVYGRRRYLGKFEPVVEDLDTLHRLLEKDHGYTMKLGRPPHYVDRIEKGLSSYDAYAVLGYQYMAASFDGAGWLPLATYEAEVEATWKPLEAALSADPDSLRGQIIFQKDGFNMARRTPVADGLARQLELLSAQGYQVVTVSELLARSPFADVGPGHPAFEAARDLAAAGLCPAFRDNTIRPDAPLTRGELAMMVFGWEAAPHRVRQVRQSRPPCSDVPAAHPYAGAIALAAEAGCIPAGQPLRPGEAADAAFVKDFLQTRYGRCPALPGSGPFTHGQFLPILAQAAL